MKKMIEIQKKLLIGRSEWCALPLLNVPLIKAKIDTGAKTSALHAFNIECDHADGQARVHYDIHPIQGNDDVIVRCTSLVIDQRMIMSSNGHKENRYVISTSLSLGTKTWPIELTLSNRDPLRFRLLLGREALNRRVMIDPNLNYHQDKPLQ
ncbi:MAG: RimK/LysX family protein [Legionellaceae bacterium]|nr:RimK/LysX family protein [Legionellaceae bacterium]